MAHEVTFTIPERKLGKADIRYSVKKDGAMLGTLLVRKGTIDWIHANDTYGRRLTWTELAAAVQGKGKRVRPG